MNAFIISQLREAPSLSAKLHQAVIRAGFALTGICAFCSAQGRRVDLQTSRTEITRLCSLGSFTHLALVYGCNASTNQKKGDYAFEEKTTSDARSPQILLRCTARNVGELEAPILQHRTKRDSHWLGARNVEELCQMPVSLFGQELERH